MKRMFGSWAFLLFGLACHVCVAGPAEIPAVVSAASRQPEVAPGSLALLIGEGLAEEAVAIEPWQRAVPPQELNGVAVLVNGIPAGVIYVTPSEVCFVVPETLRPGEAEVLVVRNGTRRLAKSTASIVSVSPGLFSEDNSGRGAGRIFHAETWSPGPFRVHTRTDSGLEVTRIVLAATGLRNAKTFSGSGQEGEPGESVTVAFLTSGSDGSIREWVVKPESVKGAEDHAGLDHVVAALPAELNGQNEVWVAVRAAGKQSNLVTMQVLLEEAPQILAIEPRTVAPGQVLRIAGKGFAGTFDGRDRIVLLAGDKLVAHSIPFPSLESQPGDFWSGALRIVTPPLAESPQSDWYEGPVQVCVETDGLRGCAADPIEMVKPQPSAAPPGDVLTASVEKIFEAMAKMAAEQDPGTAEKMRAAKERALADLRAKISAALSGNPERIIVPLPDGEELETEFDLAAIQKLEALLESGRPLMDDILPALERGMSKEIRTSTDWDAERQIQESYRNHEELRRNAEVLARLQLAAALPALAACLVSGPACLAAAAAVSQLSPVIAAASLLHTAGIMSIELRPNTLEELRVSPAYLELRPGQRSSFDVRGRFVSALSPAEGLPAAAAKVISKILESAFGLGFSAGFLADKTLGPVMGMIAGKMMEMGLGDLVTLPAISSREAGLSWRTVNSTCIRGSSPSPGAAYFLGSWEVTAFRGMASPERCQFAPRQDAMLMTSAAKTPVSAVVFVSGPLNCKSLAALASTPVFREIRQIAGPNANGDRVVLGFTGNSTELWMALTGTSAQIPNEMFCERLTLTPGCTAEVYVPTAEERDGRFPGWGLRNPYDGMPFPGDIIPRPLMGPMGGLLALRVRNLQGCGN
jgi:uncharacterized protein (TIGR03437 family)